MYRAVISFWGIYNIHKNIHVFEDWFNILGEDVKVFDQALFKN